ncbi:MAG: hypothetical protein ACR2NT_05610 [Acidimicrobiia bacterium]
MNETQAEVLTLIETVAKNRGENMAIFMDSNDGTYWTDRYYRAAPDVQQKQAPVVETNGFILLREEAHRLRKQDNDLSAEQAIMKAAQLHPDLVESHETEMRGIVA